MWQKLIETKSLGFFPILRSPAPLAVDVPVINAIQEHHERRGIKLNAERRALQTNPPLSHVSTLSDCASAHERRTDALKTRLTSTRCSLRTILPHQLEVPHRANR